jgi:hypothetical protein
MYWEPELTIPRNLKYIWYFLVSETWSCYCMELVPHCAIELWSYICKLTFLLSRLERLQVQKQQSRARLKLKREQQKKWLGMCCTRVSTCWPPSSCWHSTFQCKSNMEEEVSRTGRKYGAAIGECCASPQWNGERGNSYKISVSLGCATVPTRLC